MKATKNNIKLLNEYIQDIGRATEFIESRFLLSPEEFMKLPYATQKNLLMAKSSIKCGENQKKKKKRRKEEGEFVDLF